LAPKQQIRIAGSHAQVIKPSKNKAVGVAWHPFPQIVDRQEGYRADQPDANDPVNENYICVRRKTRL
jgi:hypothetical protein